MVKICFCTLGCPDWDIPTIALRAAEYGFDGAEMRLKDRKHIDIDASDEEIAQMHQAFAENGVVISGYSGYTWFNDVEEEGLKANYELLVKNLKFAAKTGVPFVRTFIGYTKDDVASTAQRAGYWLNLAGREAEKLGVKVLVETHDAFCMAKELLPVFACIDNDGVGVLWDIGNSIAKGESPEETYAAIGSKILHCHFKDSVTGPDGKHVYVDPGQGELPLSDALRLLKQNGFDGFISYEWEKMWVPELEEPEIAFPKFVTYIRKTWEEL